MGGEARHGTRRGIRNIVCPIGGKRNRRRKEGLRAHWVFLVRGAWSRKRERMALWLRTT